MRIVVCLKQVLDPASVRVSSRGELDVRDGVLTTNAADLCALEEALRLKDTQGSRVIALTLGEATASDVLHEALAMGADEAVLLSDPTFAGSDAFAVAYVLSLGVSKIGQVDLVLCGSRSWDDLGGQVGPQVAELLGWAQITSACDLQVASGHVSATQQLDDGDRRLTLPLPAVASVEALANTPHLPTAVAIMHPQMSIVTWSAADLGSDPQRTGAAGSLTTVRRAFAPDAHVRGEILSGSAIEAARALVAHLRQRGII
jgi:electron transfer flavoprotein beta subunit